MHLNPFPDAVLRGDERYLRLLPAVDLPSAGTIEVTERFREVVDLFVDLDAPGARTPAGFTIVTEATADRTVVDLVRDIGADTGGVPRPTPLLFSADSANPHEIAACAPLIANVTCNPGIVYDLFLNDPTVNVGREYGTVHDVLTGIADAVGPGCDVSVEITDPYGASRAQILEEIASYEEILTRHRLVVKIPHTGPIAPEESSALLLGDGLRDVGPGHGRTRDFLRGHELARELTELGHRINFTLMFEPHQTPLALQVRPYFINAFVRHRLGVTRRVQGLLAAYDASADEHFLRELRDYLVRSDYLGTDDADTDLLEIRSLALDLTTRRSSDGLDSVRQSLRWLSTAALPDTRLIVCSMEGESMFPDLLELLIEPEMLPLHQRVLITTDPAYLARWAGSPHVVTYQRRFLRAVQTT